MARKKKSSKLKKVFAVAIVALAVYGGYILYNHYHSGVENSVKTWYKKAGEKISGLRN
jgi:hypothetical protein